MYVFVGGLFLLAAAFYFQKKLPDGKKILLLNPQVKRWETLIAITVILIAVFVLIFSRYEDQSLSFFLENNEKTT
jgi:Ca2+/Na+ antiporter